MSEPITVEERYTTATHTSNMRVEADKRGDADLMIAAGWCSSTLGSALLRLHSEWDGLAKPRKMTKAAIEAYAATLDGTEKQKLLVANRDATAWHIHEIKLMLGQLKGLPSVREQLIVTAHRMGIANPVDVAVAVLVWWLDHVCLSCHGQQREVIKDTPILSDVVCPVCRGSGERELPHGQDGRAIERVIKESLGMARTGIKKRLHRA